MFERYTERARRALFFARYETSQIGHSFIEPEHLLLGIFHVQDERRGSGREGKLIARFGVSRDDLRAALLHGLDAREKVALGVEIPFSKETKDALKYAAEEADRLLHNYIGPEHLLLGVLRMDGCAAAAALVSRGMTLAGVREAIVQLPRTEPDRPARPDVDIGSDLTPGSTFADIRIAPSRDDGHGLERGGDGTWAVEGAPLSSIIQTICQCPPGRLELQNGLDEGRHDFTMNYSRSMSREARNGLMLEFIKAHFDVTVARERRDVDVFVLTAPSGPGPELQRAPETAGGVGGMSVSVESMDFNIGDSNFGSFPLSGPPTPDMIEKIRKSFEAQVKARKAWPSRVSMSGTAMEEFCRAMELVMGRPVVDDTGLSGRYDLNIGLVQLALTPDASRDAFYAQLRDRFGLVLTPARRDVEFVVVKNVKKTSVS